MLCFPRTRFTITTRQHLLASLVALISLVSASASATPSVISTGVYGDWLIGYDDVTHIVTGYFGGASSTGHHGCSLYFVGNLAKSPANIRVFSPDKPEAIQDGTLTTHLPGTITVGLNAGPRPCATVPLRLELHSTRFYQWKEVRVIQSPSVRLFELPDPKSRSTKTLELGDAVGVRSVHHGWLEVNYARKAAGAFVGWAPEAGFYPRPSPPISLDSPVRNRPH